MIIVLPVFKNEKYCLSKKSWPSLHSKLLYKVGQDFLDILKYIIHVPTKENNTSRFINTAFANMGVQEVLIYKEGQDFYGILYYSR